jgi:hypothetical protein
MFGTKKVCSVAFFDETNIFYYIKYKYYITYYCNPGSGTGIPVLKKAPGLQTLRGITDYLDLLSIQD